MELSEPADPFPDLESKENFEFDADYSSLYFTAKDHRMAARRHGVINICNDTIWKQQDKFRDTGENIIKGKEFAWYKMEILKEASNGMVIVDNFILSRDNKIGQYNLHEILRYMLPESLNEEYVLSIFYFDDSTDEIIRNTRREQFYQSIYDFVKINKKNLNLKLELFPTSANGKNYQKDFHDRAIITNNIWIGSEAGFDILVKDHTTNLNSRAIKTTKTHGLYLGFGDEAANWLETAYEVLITEAKQCLQKYKYKSINRLLI